MPETLSAWLSELERRHHKAIDLGLERCSRVWHALGAPRPGKRVITVGGTNGKGSAVAYLAALLAAGEQRVGTYTSPHVLRFNERVRLPEGAVGDAVLVDAFRQVDAARGNTSLTYFEFTTLAAFLLMAEAALDWAVLEVGLGGRLDTVNLVDADAAVIMPVGLDHQEYLGTDRESIGAEKAGIMRPGAPVTCGDRIPPRSILAGAQALDAPLRRIGPDFDHGAGARDRFRWGARTFYFPDPPLRGEHQRDNLATAMAAALSLAPDVLDDEAAWTAALARVVVTGRLTGHPADPRIILDVGHNPLAAGVVASELSERELGQVHCVLGMLRDKDAEGVFSALDGQVKSWHLASLPGERGHESTALRARLYSVRKDAEVAVYPDVAAALAGAAAVAAVTDRILVFGSFQTIGAAVRALDARAREPAH